MPDIVVPDMPDIVVPDIPGVKGASQTLTAAKVLSIRTQAYNLLIETNSYLILVHVYIDNP